MKSNDELNNDTISVIENLVFVYENLNILNNEFIREHLDFAIKSIKNMEKEFAELKQAKSDGRLVELPCAAGNTVWVLDRDGTPREMILDEPDIRCHCKKEDNLCMALCDAKNTGVCAYRLKNDGSDLGKKIFLTREAAEAALSEMEGE